MRVHALRRELALGDQLLDRVHVDSAVHLAEELRLLFRPIAVADRIDQKIAQGMALEQFAENVVDLAAERRARLFQLLKQAAIDLAFARVGRAQVPEVADFRLTDAVDAAEALFNSVRIPRQVIVDHEVRAALKVHAFAGGVVRDHHADDRVGIEGGDRGAPGFSCDAAVNHDHGSRVAKPGDNLLLQVFERVLGLGEDQDFPPQPGCRIEHDRFVEDRLQLAPLGVLPGKLQAQRASFEVRQNCDLGFEFGERLRGRRLIENLLLRPPLLRRRNFVDVVGVVGRQLWRSGERHRSALPHQLLFAKPFLKPLASPFERAMDRRRRRRQAPLKDLQREADIHAALVVAGSIGAVHLLAHVGRHRLIEIGLRQARANSSPCRRGVRETAACRRTDRVPLW